MGAPAEGPIDEESAGGQAESAEDGEAVESPGTDASSGDTDHLTGSRPDPDQQ